MDGSSPYAPVLVRRWKGAFYAIELKPRFDTCMAAYFQV